VSTMAIVHVDVPDEIHRKAKAAAALKGMSLKDFVVEALVQATKDSSRKAK
jgi:predicted HicB family RNase H-like nuclease